MRAAGAGFVVVAGGALLNMIAAPIAAHVYDPGASLSLRPRIDPVHGGAGLALTVQL